MMSRKGASGGNCISLDGGHSRPVSIYLTANIRLFRQASTHVSLKILYEISYKSRKIALWEL